MNQSINTDSKNSKEPQQKYRLGMVSIKILGGLNRFYGRPISPSFFEGLERNLLPPSQIQISPKLTDDATLIYRNNGVDAGKVVSKLVLWIPRMVFNSDGLSFVQNNHTKTEWVYLREMVQVSQDSEKREATVNITSGVKQPKHIHVFVYLQRTVRSSNQEQNPHILDTFKVNADNNDCYLSAARLEVGNGV